MKRTIFTGVLLLLFTLSTIAQQNLLIEAESFSNKGGWVVDQQFVHIMGSPYLLAHGMGEPVDNAETTVSLPEAGTYKLWVRTKDWVPDHADTPGTFKVKLNDTKIETTFGTNEGWNWVEGGSHQLSGENLSITLIDQTGFEGRCDAIFLTTDLSFTPPNDTVTLASWRRTLSGLSATPPTAGTFDLVVVGGGIAGCAAAISAARLGNTVAIIQDRPVFGGNASEEVRVHTLGLKGYKIVDEIDAGYNPSGDDIAIHFSDRRQEVMDNETNISQFVSTRAYGVNLEGNKISSIDAKNIESGEELRFFADVFIDCTGDGWIGYWAGNRFMIGRESTEKFEESIAPEIADSMMMGSSVLFTSKDTTEEISFPEVPWAMDVAKEKSATYNEWFWEYGIGLDPFADAEHIRDHLFRAIYGAFYNAKQKSENANKTIHWMGYIMGKRESRRLVGHHILVEDDIREAFDFPDGVAIEKRAIDLHLPKNNGFDFISRALFTDVPKYTIPYRSLVAADISNLMMAGRCLSASHVALGSPRVMNTCGQMGVATGAAAHLCSKYDIEPLAVYTDHISELRQLVGFEEEITLPEGSLYLDNLDSNVDIVGEWTNSSYTEGYYSDDYLHDNNELKGDKSVKFNFNIQTSGNYKIYTRHTSGNNRASNTPMKLSYGSESKDFSVNQQEKNGQWVELGEFELSANDESSLTITTTDTDGYVIADAVALSLNNATNIDAILVGNPSIHKIELHNNVAVIKCHLPKKENIRLEIFDIMGRKISTVAHGTFSQGMHGFPVAIEKAQFHKMLVVSFSTSKHRESRKFFIQN